MSTRIYMIMYTMENTILSWGVPRDRNSDFYLESPTTFTEQNISDSTVHIYRHSHKQCQCSWSTDSQNRQITLKWQCITWRNDFVGPQMSSKWHHTVTNEVQGSSNAVNTGPPPVMFVCTFTSYSTAACEQMRFQQQTAQSMNWFSSFVMSWFTSLGLHPSKPTVLTSLNHPVWYTAGLNSLVIF